MHIINTVATTLSLTYLASCTDISTGNFPVNPGLVLRTDHSSSPAAAGSERMVQIVTVGDTNGSLKFFPENVKAEVGSVVQFQFYPKNHTITESTFAEPCKPMPANMSTPERPGQKSGFVPVTPDAQFRPVYNLIVNDTKPIWIFCGQMPHCQKGMSMVINVNESSTDKTLEKYKEAAAKLPVPPPPAAGAPAPPAGSASASAGSASASATFGGGASASTVTPPAATASAAGPSLAGTVTSAAAISGSGAAASIATFTGAATPRELPVAGMLAAGALWAFL
ncbi:hypothetical protein PMZ80_003027 [Knufia obscura]|uniref:Cupredoxin n=1 Tax=Knufia obscura TaxID=1635080 RepID=A0ABR0S0E5_9EURO|nr:hypothetical protein PMZ80_003027 [Knufia obscura]